MFDWDDLEGIITALCKKIRRKKLTSAEMLQEIIEAFIAEEQRSGNIYFNLEEQKYYHKIKIADFDYYGQYEKFLLKTNRLAVNIPGACGETLLIAAAHAEEYHIVKWLCDQGANVNLCDSSGISPVFAATRGKNSKIVEYLLTKKADVNACTNNVDSFSTAYGPISQKQTPLHNAVRYGNFKACKILFDNGAILAENAEGDSPFDLVTKYLDIIKHQDDAATESYFGTNSESYPSLEALESIQSMFRKSFKYKSYIQHVNHLNKTNDISSEVTLKETRAFITLLKFYFPVVLSTKPELDSYIKTKILEYILGDLRAPKITNYTMRLFNPSIKEITSEENEAVATVINKI